MKTALGLAALLFLFSATVSAQPYATLGVIDVQEGAGVSPGIGYRIGKYFAAETAYFSLGEVRHDSSNTSSPDFLSTVNESESWKLKGFRLSALGSVPVGNFSVLGRVSAYRLNGDHRRQVNAHTPTSSSSSATTDSGSGWTPGLGIGIAYNFSPNIQVRAMLERIGNKSGMFGNGNDLGALNTKSFDVVITF